MALTTTRSVVDVSDLVLEDRVHRRVYTDPAIFEQEMRLIFERTWVFVGHESEVPQPGDYKTTRIGRNPVIMVRHTDGQICVLLNRCMHRGAVVCRDESGSTNHFRCGYHGWTYNTRGDLVVVTARGGYGPEFDTQDFGLIRVPRVESYRGFVFACLDPAVNSLDRHLGRAKHYLDLGMDLAPDGEIEARSGAQRYWYAGNWKFQIENWTDHYHPAVVHETAFALRGRRSGGGNGPNRSPHDTIALESGWVTSLPHGINTERVRGARGDINSSRRAVSPGAEEYLRVLTARRGEERTTELLEADVQLMAFPNFFIQPRRQHFRVVRPIAVDRTEVWAFPYALKGAPEEINRRMTGELAGWASAAGYGQPDDLEMFVRCQEGLQVAAAEWVYFGRGLHTEELLPEGEIRGESETTHRGLYREWKRLMSAD